jgi:uncharacterized cofD-like protein
LGKYRGVIIPTGRLPRYSRSTGALTLRFISGIVVRVALKDTAVQGDRWRQIKRWLKPGLGVKRWLLILVIGTALIGLGLAVLLLEYYRTHPDAPLLALISLRALPRWTRALALGSVGLGLMLLAIIRLNRALLAPYLRPGKPVVDAVAEHRRLGRGPRIVALGGGTGLSTLLRGLKRHSSNLTAIVTVADDGGSSGKLRRSLGLPPPGDLRSCLAALSDDEDLLTQLFQYRFMDGSELDGHAFGNLFIAALAGVTGSFDQGILEAGRVLAIRGQVLPATLAEIELVADKEPELDAQAVRVEGESHIPRFPGRIRHIHLEPNDPPAFPEAIRAILAADMIIIGPGSLYTSVLPNLLVRDLAQAIRSSRAFKAYVCNVATQPGETDEYTCDQHVKALDDHVGRGLFDLVVANDRIENELADGLLPVQPPTRDTTSIPCYCADLIDPERPWRHDAHKLAATLIALLEERTGPLELPSIDRVEPLTGLN